MTIKLNYLLDSPQTTLKQGNALLRLVKLDAALTLEEEKRAEIEEKITDICQQALCELNQTYAESKATLNRELEKLCPHIPPIYFLQTNNKEELEKAVNRLLRDLSTVVTPPLRRTFQGLEGPTFLVNFTKFSPNNSVERFNQCVIKWTNWNEISCSTIYKFFSRCGLFSVPKTAAYDLEKETFTENEGLQMPLQSEEVVKLDHLFTDLKATCASGCQGEDPHVMISERIDGENIRAFTYTKFNLLNEKQKFEIFRQLGAISLLDLILGNDDRLVPIQYNEETGYCLKPDEANLGNAMITWDGNELPKVHAIDNGIDNRFIDEPEYAPAYKTFLVNLFNSSDFTQVLSESMVQNIERTVQGTSAKFLQSTADYDKIKAEKMEEFKKGLRPIALEAFQLGIGQMGNALRGGLIEKWKGKSKLKLTIEKPIPELLPEIEKRIDLFLKN